MTLTTSIEQVLVFDSGAKPWRHQPLTVVPILMEVNVKLDAKHLVGVMR